MAYLGNSPEKGNFRKCDAITTSATATYNLLVGGVAVNPNQNQCIVSLNGVIQSSGNSYTIASSQITFASTLASSDVIDFILILGDTLNVGTVSDDTIGLAQLSATGSPSSSNFLRGDNAWTDPGGVALTGSTNNTVATVTGANALIGEANLTFDGTDLTLGTGNIIFGTAAKGVYLGVTTATAANLLDDYEEGTWTPSLGGNTSYHTQTGTYTKIGRSVTIQGHLYINTIGTGSTTSITGLPFAATQPQPGSVNIAKWANLSQSVVDLTGVIPGAGGTQVNATGMTAAAATNTENLAVIQGTTIMFFSATYFTT